jgi:hypothetical protein
LVPRGRVRNAGKVMRLRTPRNTRKPTPTLTLKQSPKKQFKYNTSGKMRNMAIMEVVRRSLDIFGKDTVIDVNDSPNSDINEFEGSLPEFKIVLDILATKVNDKGIDKIRKVLFGMWVVHFAIMTTIVWLSLKSQAVGTVDRLGLFMIVLQLYFAKILKSLNQMYDKTMAIQSDSKSIQEDIVEISKIHKDKKKEYEKVLTSQKYIMIVSDLEHRLRNLATYILKDLRTYTDSLRTLSLIINAFFWKSPYYKKYLERNAVSEAAHIINRHIDRKVEKCIENQRGKTDSMVQQAAAQAMQSSFYNITRNTEP